MASSVVSMVGAGFYCSTSSSMEGLKKGKGESFGTHFTSHSSSSSSAAAAPDSARRSRRMVVVRAEAINPEIRKTEAKVVDSVVVSELAKPLTAYCRLYVVRGKLQNLIEHNVSPDFIFKTLVGELKKHLNEQLRHQVDCQYEEYNREEGSQFDSEKPLSFASNRHEEMGKWLNDPLKKNVQLFMRIEEFIAKFMSFYKNCSVMNKQGQGISYAL